MDADHSFCSSKAEATINGSNEDDEEDWMSVRNLLLQRPKFSQTLRGISEEDWRQRRTESLQLVLRACGNFHGTTKGQMWDDLIGAVKSHLGTEHKFLDVISEFQANMWTVCSLTTVSDSTSLGSYSTAERELYSDTYTRTPPGESETSYNSPQRYRAAISPGPDLNIELIEPLAKGTLYFCMHHHDWRWLLLYVPLVLLLVGVMAAMVTLLETRQDASTRSVETMEGVTVYLDSQMAILYKGWEIKDCSQKLSNSSNRTLGFVQRVQTNDLVYHKRIILPVDGYNINNVSLTESKLEVFAPSGSIYLLKGSYVDYHICFHNFNNSSSQPSSEVNVLIFNSISNSLAFMHSSKSDEKTAIFSKELHLGGGSRNVCTTVNFNVTHADFYLVIFEIPKDSVLSFNSSTHQVYFNYTDPRTADCDIKSQGSCFVEIPGGIFSTEKYTIVSYEPYDDNSYRENTNSSESASSSVTQLCVTPKRSLLISVIPAAIISLLLLLLLVVGSLHFTSYTFSIKRRRGYICVKPTTK